MFRRHWKTAAVSLALLGITVTTYVSCFSPSLSQHFAPRASLPPTTAQGTITANGGSVVVNTAYASSVAVEITGTWSGTLGFQTSYDGGTTWQNVSALPLGGGAAASSTTTNGVWRLGVVSSLQMQVVATAWSSGTATVTLTPAPGTITAHVTGTAGTGSAVNGNPVLTGWQDQNGNVIAPYGNQDLTLLTSAARTSTTNSPTQTNQNSRGVLVFLNITAASGTGGLQLRIQGLDPVSGVWFYLNVATSAITSTGNHSFELYPGDSVGGSTDQRTPGVVPHQWRVQVIHNDSSSYTYTVGASLIN